MNSPTPHYLLKTEASQESGSGRWRFVLTPLDGSPEVEAADVEPDVWGERLNLLTVVRALESLDQPSWVTLVGCTQYVEQGIAYGIAEWRESGWRWEFFGQMTPVRDIDLWQRMDRILQFHRVDCGRRRFDAGHVPLNGPLDGPHWGLPAKGKELIGGLARDKWVECCALVTAVWHGLRTKAATWVQGGSRANDRVFGYD
jgi:ribonuclease HI